MKVKVVARYVIKGKHIITTVRCEAERVIDHNQPLCRPLAKVMDVQQLQTLPGIFHGIATYSLDVFKEKSERIQTF